MKESNASLGNKVALGFQISLLICFYILASGVFTFLGYAVYRSVVDNDDPVHSVALASVITFAFLILTSIVTMLSIYIHNKGRPEESP